MSSNFLNYKKVLGFRDTERFNKALVAKQARWILHCPESLMASLVRTKYSLNSSFLKVYKFISGRFVWDIAKLEEVLRKVDVWVHNKNSFGIDSYFWKSVCPARARARRAPLTRGIVLPGPFVLRDKWGRVNGDLQISGAEVKRCPTLLTSLNNFSCFICHRISYTN